VFETFLHIFTTLVKRLEPALLVCLVIVCIALACPETYSLCASPSLSLKPHRRVCSLALRCSSVLTGLSVAPTVSDVARPRFFEGARIFTLSEQQYFVWDTASQSAKRHDMLAILGGMAPPGCAYSHCRPWLRPEKILMKLKSNLKSIWCR